MICSHELFELSKCLKINQDVQKYRFNQKDR